MNLSGNYFYYDDKNSAQYGLKIMHIETDRIKKLSADIQYQTSYTRATKTFVINGTNFSDKPMEFDIEFISEEPIPSVQSRKITSWLFNKAGYRKLYSDIRCDNTKERVNGVIKREFMECVFYDPEEIRFADGLHGWKATCMIATPMATQEEIIMTVTDFSKNIMLPVNTDIDDYVYPHVTIIMKKTADVTMINKSDKNRMVVINELKNTGEICMDNAIGTITDSADQSLYNNLKNHRFFRLIPGNNDISMSTSVSDSMESITFKWSNARWLV